MEHIDREWIQKKLAGRRGEKVELARAMGIGTDKLSKILKGDRNIQAREIPGLLAYFDEDLKHGDTVSDYGMAEGAAPYTPNAGDVAATLLAQSAPGGPVLHLFQATRGAPALAILAGDLLGVELAGTASAGDMVLATAADTSTGAAYTFVARYFPPWLVDGQMGLEAVREDAPDLDVAIMGKVWAVLRRPKVG